MTWPVFRGWLAVPLEVRAPAMTTGPIVEIVLGVAAEGKSHGDIASPLWAVRAAAEPESELTHRSRRPAERGGARMSRRP
jgi:hypothetical protein